jgi:hypothetical protein
MELQNEISPKMRTILLDWLVEVHKKYKFRRETLFLTVSLIDRYLSRCLITRRRLQLVGVTAMFIAAKFEEIEPPPVQDFAYITDNAYKKDEILNLECSMLTALGFQISSPTCAHFSDQLHKINDSDSKDLRIRELSCYLSELALLEYRMIRFLPSHLVAATTLLSNELVGRDQTWPLHVAQQARYTEEQLRICVNELRALLQAAPSSDYQTIRRQYMLPEHQGVAVMNFPEPAASAARTTAHGSYSLTQISRMSIFEDNDELGGAIEIAIEATKDAILSKGLDSEWSNQLCQRIRSIATVKGSLEGVLAAHGWNGVQFRGPPCRQRLFDDLCTLRRRTGGQANRQVS